MHDIIKSVISIHTIMLIRLFFGFYYKISSSIFVDILERAYCLALVILLNLHSYLLTNLFFFPGKLRYGLQSTVHAINVITNLLFSSENLFEFMKRIKNVSQRLNLSDVIPFSRIFFIFLLLGKFIGHIFYGYRTSDNLLDLFSPGTLALIFELSQHASNFTRIIMFEILWHRMTMLRKELERDLSTARRFEEREEVMRKKLRSCLKTYKNLLNTTHATDLPMKFMVNYLIKLQYVKTY